MFPTVNTILVCRVRNTPNNVGSFIYNTIYQELGVNALYLQFGSDNSARFADALRTMNFRGCTVVGTHSKDLIPYLDELDPHAEKVGKINTITNTNGRLKGYKTDGPALIDALREVTELRGKKIVILGAGALVRELSFLLPNYAPLSVTVFNRSEEKARHLCAEIGFKYGGNISQMQTQKGDIFINASDVGASFCDTKDVFQDELVAGYETIADVTYIPFSTPLQEKAFRFKKTVIPGWRMFAYQGAKQIELYLGKKAPIDRLCELIKEEFSGS